HGMTPRRVQKAVADVMVGARAAPGAARGRGRRDAKDRTGPQRAIRAVDTDPTAFGKLLDDLEAKMYDHAKNLEFEEAAAVRDELRDLRATYLVN
ncbi:MAG: excinuclease ABC subunit B, partial [Gammaproteobacteria bacterium]|nr:excinuclease ABC subunit B [Gammaproteobacteria bacterium]